MVRRFLLGGAKVALTARSPSGSLPDAALFVQADVGTPEGVAAVAERIQAEWAASKPFLTNIGSG